MVRTEFCMTIEQCCITRTDLIVLAVQNFRNFIPISASIFVFVLCLKPGSADSGSTPDGWNRLVERNRDYVVVARSDGSERRGYIPKSLFNGAPAEFRVVDLPQELSRRGLAPQPSGGLPCGPVDLDGSDPAAEANIAATSLVGNTGVSVVPGSAVVSSWPGYGLISSWHPEQAFRTLFPNGLFCSLLLLRVEIIIFLRLFAHL
jgi:hypothetical protein